MFQSCFDKERHKETESSRQLSYMVTGEAWQGQVVLVSVLDNLLSSVGVGFIIRRGGFIDLVGVYCLQVRVSCSWLFLIVLA